MNTKNRKRIRVIGKILFVLYVIFIIYFLIFSDWYGRTGTMDTYHYNLVPFQEIMRFWNYRADVGLFAMFTNLFGNVIIFIPFGIFLPMASKYRNVFSTVFWSFGISLCVEIFQLITKVGCFDVDDLILNTLGGLMGHAMYTVFEILRRRHVNKKKKKSRR